MGDYLETKNKYISSAFLLVLSSVIVKVIGAVYKIPLTAFVGAVGRGYFAAAYNVYLPVHALLMGAFPTAVSRLVSKYSALGNKRMLSSIKNGSMTVFFISGVIGMAVIIAAAKPYSVYIASSPKSVYTIYVLAPSILFSCLAACYRGYFEGCMNMTPTAVSQTAEALFKMVFGLLFARMSMAYMYNCYTESGAVFGVKLNGEAQALSFIYPFSSAAAMFGVTLGAAVSYIYVFIYYLINTDKSLPKVSGRDGRRELLSFSFPIMVSCSVQSVFQFLDTASVQYSLGKLNPVIIERIYPDISTLAGSDYVTYVFGLFSTALDFKNLVPGVTMALGVCAVPAICREYERKNGEKLSLLMNSVYKYTALLSCFGGCFIALAAEDILSLFYSSSPDIISGCRDIVFWFGVTVPAYSLASTAVFCVQALGKPERSVFPYIISGLIRVLLNVVLIRFTNLYLLGAVAAGAAGYTVLFIQNAVISKRIAKVNFEFKNVIIKPVFVSAASFFISKKAIILMQFTNSLFFNLLIKMTVFGGIYCILCIFVKLINFKQIFCALKIKKMA